MHYDIAIIGTGAGGGTLLHALAPPGKRILVLERGDYVPREKANWSTRAVNFEGRYTPKEVWRDRDGQPLHPHTKYYVGGNTKFYGAALFRLRREDFGEIKHWGGVSPAWPIGYEDLEPYYTQAERLYHVHGERREDPTDPPASAPYPHPAVSHEPRIQQLHDDWAGLGLRPFHVPLGVMLDEKNPHASRCIRCETCDGHPCLVGAKSDAPVVCVRARGDAHRGEAGSGHRAALRGRGRGLAGGDQLGGPAAPLGERPASARARQRVGRGGTALHGARQLGVHGHLQVPESDRVPRAQRFLLRLAGVGVPDGPHLVRGQARRGYPAGGGARDRARLDAGRDGQALDGLLAHVRGPAGSGEPEVDNLYVVDGSFFPSSAAVNPALTIMANALRVADHLKARL